MHATHILSRLLLATAVTTFLLLLLSAPAANAQPGGVTSLELIQTVGGKALPLALGGNRDREALAPRNVPEDSASGQLLKGSFLGALIFGQPYEGVKLVDLLLLGLLTVVIGRAVAARRGRADQDRFTARAGKATDLENPGTGPTNENSRRVRPEDLRPANGQSTVSDKEHQGKDHAGKDNLWTRRLNGDSSTTPTQPRRPATVQENAAAAWSRFSSIPSQEAEVREDVADGVQLPAGFDVHDFLEGARTLYVRLQQAWGARKVDELEPFVSAAMIDVLRRQAEANPEPSPVEILLVDATLRSVTRTEDDERAEVGFKALMRAGGGEEPAEVIEVWQFERGTAPNGMWRLNGIRPADDA